ncbi:MAG: 4Fe-4S dicluster domain-containing protein [Ruminococcaceae bacterium]|nr:4Fe-4S dicluster domain-containing protein [Oscillospiraceae bacterium]
MFGAKKNFGFGCMRMQMVGDEVDHSEFTKMIDAFMDAGFNYFDTAHVYINGKSETALKKCLTSRYPRESYVLTNKLSPSNFNSNEEIRPLLDLQLEACGVEYFDFWLMHAMNTELFDKYKKCRAFETVLELKEEGKIRHLGISFHDKAEVLRQILTEYPQIEAVQIQFNYADFEDENIESRKCYEVCREFNKPIIVMEPVKGGALVNLPHKADEILRNLKGGSNASYAIRFAAGFEGVFMVLSGMGNMSMMEDNLSFMTDFSPLNSEEKSAISKVCEILKNQDTIPCTDCKYCIEGCPANIPIPHIFKVYNGKKQLKENSTSSDYLKAVGDKGKASDCILCGMCEAACPQHLKIRELLKEAAEEFEA